MSAIRLGSSALRSSTFASRNATFGAMRCYSAKAQVRRAEKPIDLNNY